MSINRYFSGLHDLYNQIIEDRSVNDSSWMRPGCQAMVMYRLGHIVVNISKKRICYWPMYLLYLFMHIFIRNFYGIEIYGTAKIGRRLRIAHQSGIIVAPNAVIGDDCLIRQGVSIGRAANHGGGVHARAPVIGNRVEIGAGAVVVGNIKVGNDVVIGPNTVVTNNVPDGTIVVSTPPRIMMLPKKNQITKQKSLIDTK